MGSETERHQNITMDYMLSHTHKQTKIMASKAKEKVNELDAKFLTVHKQNDYDIIIKT